MYLLNSNSKISFDVELIFNCLLTIELSMFAVGFPSGPFLKQKLAGIKSELICKSPSGSKLNKI